MNHKMICSNVLIATVAFTAAACRHQPTPGDQMEILSGKNKQYANEWKKGDALMDKGNAEISQGEKLVKKGEAKIRRGQRDIAKGNQLMRDNEASFQENLIEASIHELDDC